MIVLRKGRPLHSNPEFSLESFESLNLLFYEKVFISWERSPDYFLPSYIVPLLLYSTLNTQCHCDQQNEKATSFSLERNWGRQRTFEFNDVTKSSDLNLWDGPLDPRSDWRASSPMPTRLEEKGGKREEWSQSLKTILKDKDLPAEDQVGLRQAHGGRSSAPFDGRGQGWWDSALAYMHFVTNVLWLYWAQQLYTGTCWISPTMTTLKTNAAPSPSPVPLGSLVIFRGKKTDKSYSDIFVFLSIKRPSRVENKTLISDPILHFPFPQHRPDSRQGRWGRRVWS